MRKLRLLPLAILFMFSCKQDKPLNMFTVSTHTDANGFTYETVEGDPTGLRLYTLDNGLTVYLGQNRKEPKIQTFIPIRAGSVYDPVDNTGLAHYLEHMLFKGTDEIGTQNWEKEKVLLDSISYLYEAHKAEKDAAKKKEIYKKIDQVSGEASKISIANEYDKMVAAIGAEGTNAWTWHEETVYVNKIPSNALEKWLHVEKERFSQLVLRIFHTELEAVYEEFNRGQDNDYWRMDFALNNLLFPVHPYGQQTTIGTSEHLKNPSMVAIHEYFNTYYVPNNMAVVLVGDLDYDQTIKKVNDAFGTFKFKEVAHPSRLTEEPIAQIRKAEVYGPMNAQLSMAYRFKGMGSEDEAKVMLIDMILNNSTAGLIDLNLNKKQKVQQAGSYTQFLNDYGMHTFYGNPKSGQTLEELEQLINGEIEKIKQGEFEDWLIDAVINDLKLSQMKGFEDPGNVAYAYVNAFVHFQDWKDRISLLDGLKKISKQDLVAFAKANYNNYAVVYKRQGKATDLVKVENPGITPVALNRDKKSEFLSDFEKMEMPDLKPRFVDFKKDMVHKTIDNGIEVLFVENANNDLMELNLAFDVGKDHDKALAIAGKYINYVGTRTKSPEEVNKEFYKLGIEYGVRTGPDQTRFFVKGLRENLGKGLKMLLDLVANAEGNTGSYNDFVLKIAKEREDTKANKDQILWEGLYNYGMFEEGSPLRDIYTFEELKDMDPNSVLAKLADLLKYGPKVYYYGLDLDEAVSAIRAHYTAPDSYAPIPAKKAYAHVDTGGKVYVVDYDMVQAEMLFLSKGKTFDPERMAAADLFNSYFGGSMASIVFQEIRESKSLAYAAYGGYFNANEVDKPDYTFAYIGTQANKLDQAVSAMMNLMEDMPQAEESFQMAKEATLKQMAANRTTGTNIFWKYDKMKKLGMEKNNEEAIYNAIERMTLNDLKLFFDENIKGGNYNVMVLGNKNDLDYKALSKLGEVEQLDVDQLFNYRKKLPIKD